MDVGAALVYTSATSDINCLKLQKYILHALYRDDLKLSNLEIKIEDGIGTAFIPASLDSADLIAIATGVQAADVPSTFALASAGAEPLPQTSQASASTSTESSVSIENEQDWLARLKKFISLAEVTPPTSAGSAEVGSAKPTKSASLDSLPSAEGPAGATSNGDVKPPAAASSRRSTRTASATNNSNGQDPTDFFKNLLGGEKK